MIEAKEKGIAVIDVGSDQALNEDGSDKVGVGGSRVINVT